MGPDAGAPSSKRICEDVHRIVNRTYLDIFARRGHVLDTAAYTGRIAVQQAERFAAPWGGRRTKGEGSKKTFWVHPVVKKYEDAMVAGCRADYDLTNLCEMEQGDVQDM